VLNGVAGRVGIAEQPAGMAKERLLVRGEQRQYPALPVVGRFHRLVLGADPGASRPPADRITAGVVICYKGSCNDRLSVIHQPSAPCLPPRTR